jgi:uncharacterized protein
MSVVTKTLVSRIVDQFRLPLDGVHGLAHWARVFENGQRLARLTGADLDVIELFTIFHDAMRINESISPGHGERGAELARALAGDLFRISNDDLELLIDACARHTEGLTDAHVTVQTCWDADRLDLGRVGIPPARSRLCTDAARDPTVMRWAYERSRKPAVIPGWVGERWGVGR